MPGFGGLVREGKRDGRFADELVDAAVELFRSWSPEPAPEWITCVPSATNAVVADFTQRLAIGPRPAVPRGVGAGAVGPAAAGDGEQRPAVPRRAWRVRGHAIGSCGSRVADRRPGRFPVDAHRRGRRAAGGRQRAGPSPRARVGAQLVTAARTAASMAAVLLAQRLVDVPDAAPFTAREVWSILEQVDDLAALIGADAARVSDAASVDVATAERIVRRFDAATAVAFELDDLAQSGVRVLTPFDAEFPAVLAERLGTAAPTLLHVAGDPLLLARDLIGIVGSRDVSEGGTDAARALDRRSGPARLRHGDRRWHAGSRSGRDAGVARGGWRHRRCARRPVDPNAARSRNPPARSSVAPRVSAHRSHPLRPSRKPTRPRATR